MNDTLKVMAKDYLKGLLAECTAAEQLMFKRMYCHQNLDATIDQAVDQMDDSKLDRAITQTEATIEKKTTN